MASNYLPTADRGYIATFPRGDYYLDDIDDGVIVVQSDVASVRDGEPIITNDLIMVLAPGHYSVHTDPTGTHLYRAVHEPEVEGT